MEVKILLEYVVFDVSNKMFFAFVHFERWRSTLIPEDFLMMAELLVVEDL